MINQEQLFYTLKLHLFKWIEIHNEDGDRLAYFSTRKNKEFTSEEIIAELKNFFNTFGEGIYIVSAKDDSNQSAESKFKYKVKVGDHVKTVINSKIVDVEEVVNKRVHEALAQARKESLAKETLEEYKMKSKELDEWSGKLSYVVMAIFQKVMNGTKFAPLMQAVNSNPDHNTETMTENKQVQIELSESENEKVDNAIEKLLQHITVSQLVEIADLVEKHPTIVNKLDKLKFLL